MLIERYRHPVRGSDATARLPRRQPATTRAWPPAPRPRAKISCETVLPSPRSPPPRPAPRSCSPATAATGASKTACTSVATPPSPKTPPGCGPANPPRLFAAIASTVVSVLNRAGQPNHAAARRDLGWDRTGLQALDLLGL